MKKYLNMILRISRNKWIFLILHFVIAFLAGLTFTRSFQTNEPITENQKPSENLQIVEKHFVRSQSCDINNYNFIKSKSQLQSSRSCISRQFKLSNNEHNVNECSEKISSRLSFHRNRINGDKGVSRPPPILQPATDSHMLFPTSNNYVSTASDTDSWSVHTNRTLRRDQDPLHAHVHALRRHNYREDVTMKRDRSSATSMFNCTGNRSKTSRAFTDANDSCGRSCKRVSDCALCRRLASAVDSRRGGGNHGVEQDTVKLLGTLVDLFDDDKQSDDQRKRNPCDELSGVETSCIVAPYSWKL